MTHSIRMGSGSGDTVGDNRSTAQPLSLNRAVTSRIENSLDVDMFKISLTAGAIYTVKMDLGATTLGKVQAGILYVQNATSVLYHKYLSDPNQYDSNVGSSGGQDSYSFVAPASGDYYISWMADYYTSYTYNGAYTLTMSETRDDFGSTPDRAGTLDVGGTVSGVMEAWLALDVDRFAIDLQGGSNYWLTLQNPVDDSWDANLSVYDANGNLAGKFSGSMSALYSRGPDQSIEVKNGNITLPFNPAASGKYYVEVSRVSGDGDNHYTLSVNPAGTDNAGDTVATATVIGTGSAFNGTLEHELDVDVFRLPVKAGVTYGIGTTAPYYGPQLRIETSISAPKSYQQAVLSGYSDYTVFTPETSGDVYFSVHRGSWREINTYTLLAAEMPTDDLSNLRSQAGVLAVGSKFHGQLDYSGDKDWMKVHLEAGTTYLFDSWKDPSGTNLSTYEANLSFYTPNSTNLGGSAFPSSYYAPVTGDYFIEVSGFPVGYGVQVNAWSGDGVGPTLQSTELMRVAGGVLPNTSIKLVFSEYLAASGADIALKDQNGNEVQRWTAAERHYDGFMVTLDAKTMLGLGQTYTLEVGIGSVCDWAGAAGAASTMQFQTVAASASGASGNDNFSGTGAGARLDGGAGIDTVFYQGKRAAFNITANGDGYKVAAKTSQMGDTLTGVERLQFVDSAIALDIDGTAGQCYRLYRAAFDRTPDQGGVGFWIAKLDQGLSLREAAAWFLSSSEFETRYGPNLQNNTFVQKLYANVLHRTPDQNGVDFWMSALDKGVSRAEVLASFSESQENRDAVAVIIGNGFEYQPYL